MTRVACRWVGSVGLKLRPSVVFQGHVRYIALQRRGIREAHTLSACIDRVLVGFYLTVRPHRQHPLLVIVYRGVLAFRVPVARVGSDTALSRAISCFLPALHARPVRIVGGYHERALRAWATFCEGRMEHTSAEMMVV